MAKALPRSFPSSSSTFHTACLPAGALTCLLVLIQFAAAGDNVRLANYTIGQGTNFLAGGEQPSPLEPITLCAAEGCRDACPCGTAVGCGAAAGGCGCGAPIWYASAEAIFLRRDNDSRDQAVVLNGGSNQTLITTGQLNFDAEPGVRFRLGRALGEHTSVEGSYFGIYEWGHAATATGNNDLRLPGDIALATFDFLDADIMRVSYKSEIHSVETTLVHTFSRVDVLAGFRYFQLNDDFNVNSEDFVNGVSDYSIASRNSLYGGQLGLRLKHKGELISLRCTTKAGVYGVDAEQRSFLADFDNTFVLRDTHAAGGDVAFIGEVNLDAVLALTDCVRLIAGYNLMWLEGVALAPDQLDFTDTPTSGTALNHSGGVFFYGANVGLEAIW
ncbi:BBP7 family outer membrane beta-barrel protein [Pirellulales bacterium]|nr:BBP7 family outer membrane beta-barrel protein [Pirellulales bacterium]